MESEAGELEVSRRDLKIKVAGWLACYALHFARRLCKLLPAAHWAKGLRAFCTAHAISRQTPMWLLILSAPGTRASQELDDSLRALSARLGEEQAAAAGEKRRMEGVLRCARCAALCCAGLAGLWLVVAFLLMHALATVGSMQ